MRRSCDWSALDKTGGLECGEKSSRAASPRRQMPSRSRASSTTSLAASQRFAAGQAEEAALRLEELSGSESSLLNAKLRRKLRRAIEQLGQEGGDGETNIAPTLGKLQQASSSDMLEAVLADISPRSVPPFPRPPDLV